MQHMQLASMAFGRAVVAFFVCDFPRGARKIAHKMIDNYNAAAGERRLFEVRNHAGT
jgi:hypothetical protein